MIIEFAHLTIERPGGLRALDDFSAVIDSADTCALAVLGANGAGKSTLLEAIVGLVLPTSGTITVDGQSVQKREITPIRRRIGMIFQNSDDQLFSQTVREDIAFGPTNLQLPEAEVQNRVQEALQLLDITALAERDVTRLSGGEKRRVALAGVLAMHPETILLDEPTAMLDPRGVRELAEYLLKLPAMKLIATHDLAFAARLCPEALILQQGRIRVRGKTADLLANHALLRETGLE